VALKIPHVIVRIPAPAMPERRHSASALSFFRQRPHL
jgi:hypothetical protein